MVAARAQSMTEMRDRERAGKREGQAAKRTFVGEEPLRFVS